MPADPPPSPVTVVMPDGQTLTASLIEREQVPGGWRYLVGIAIWRNTDQGAVEAAEYRVWLDPSAQVKPIDGVSYDDVPRKLLPPPPTYPDPGPGEPWGWVLEKLPQRGRGPAESVLHVSDCPEAPAGAPVLKLEAALTAAENPRVRTCTVCRAAIELDPLLRGFGHEDD
ncbi:MULTISPECIES: DUF6233 domain-containing protein [unclassified Streptomyces]|uniref:DUF6233 domain-containing protein n=1 Tax=unclassified Streptomyces TaxID=2593676 RepID=UPI0036E5E9E8